MVTETTPQADGNTAFLRAARAGNLDKVLEYLKSNIDINTSNANGLNALHLASKDGHVNVVTELLKRGATVDAATKKGNTALHIASLAGQEEVVKILVQNGASVNVQSQNGFTPLYMAAQENHDNVVRFLLANGANQSLATEDGFTPLAVAMQQGHDKVVTVLLENDTRGKVRLPALHIAAKKDDCKAAALLLQNDHNPDVTSKSGFTPLHIAAHYGNENIANLLLQRGADVNYSAKHNITPLHVAAKWGKTNMVSLLIEKGANIEAKTRDGLTPLHCAARSGHEQVVDMLLERGAPISSKTKNGLAPLHMASQGDHVDAARILLYHRAPVDEVTVDYLTALHVAAHCGHVRVAKLLLDRKADPNARALNGFTPLHIACKKNRIKVVELLLKHGASIEATTESGLTPLHVASFMGCMNIVIYLIQHEANPDVPTVRGETPLHLAARANQADIIRILLRNGAQVDARAREQQTPLHIASRLGNVDIVMLLLQHGAAVDATTKDMYTALHIAAKEGQEEVASVLLEHGASLTATTKKGFTPLHLAAKYGKMKVARLLLQRDAPVDAQGKNGVTPLHVASHYDHQNVALLLLDKGASPHATAKNGHTPLHIAARKNQMDIATTLLEYGAKANAESKAGFTPLHLSSQEGHTDMSTLLIEHQADPNHKAKNGLTPLHLCAQEDRVNVATILVKNGAEVDAKTKAGYTPLHVACHFGQINMVRFLLQHGVDVNSATSAGYTPLHQAAQQGHVLIINLLLESRASPNAVTNQGQTALSIAQKLGYISVVETLKVVTETVITTTTTITTEEKYRVMAPETMQETFMSDSEDEGGEDTMLSDQPYRYLTVDEMKSLGDDSLPIDVTRDERGDSNRDSMAPPTAMEDSISPQHSKEHYSQFSSSYAPDNVDIARHPVHVGKLQWKTFLVSFMVDARGGAMRGCRHSGVRVIVPPRKAAMPMRITCRYLKKDKLAHPPPLMEGEALASRILELGPVAAKFLGPVIIEVPHFGSLRGKEREIVILRSDNGETWREHTLEASEEAIQDVLNESFDGEELTQLEDLNTNRITRILTTDFPQYFAIVSRVRQEVHAIGPEGGMVSSTVVPQVQAVFPQGALTKKIKVGLQAQPISAELVAKLLGNRVAVSPIVTVEPRRRKFHKPITLTIPVPQAANKGMINQYSGDAPTLRLLCSITGGTTRAQWEDVTGSTPLTFVNDCVSFTTTVSARFWLMDCRNIAEATKMATELYKEAIHVPFMAKFVVFAKRVDVLEARLRVFCMTDDKEDKTLEHQEHFTEVAKSRDVEVLEGKSQFVEFAGNLVPVTKSGDQLQLGFHAFKENRLPFTVRVKDPHADTVGRILFMREPKVAKGEPPQSPICILNIVLPETITPEMAPSEPDLLELEKKYSFLRDGSLSRTENIHKADLRLSDICNLLGLDWIQLANELGIAQDDIHLIQSEYPDSVPQQAMVMLRLWMQQSGNKATGNTLEKSLRKINREDIVDRCIFNVELVTDDMEKAVAKVRLDQSGFDNLKEELGPSRDTSLRRNVSLDVTYDEQDIMKESESVEELVAAEKIVTPKEDRLAHESEVEAKDSIREKDVGAEKIGDEVRKSIKDYEREEQKYVGEEKEYKEFEEALMKDAPKPVHEEITKKRGHEEVKEAAFVKDESKKSPTIMAGMADDSGDDKKRKADMIAEITEELGRLDTSYKGGAPMPVKEAVTSPKISKTPPPSPAEFKEGTVMSTKVTHEFPARDIVVGEEHTEYITPDGTTVRQTTITKTTIVQGAEPSITEEAAQLAESETWQSDDQSTHPEELSSVQEWAEKMQQKHSAGHGGPATEDAGFHALHDAVAPPNQDSSSIIRTDVVAHDVFPDGNEVDFMNQKDWNTYEIGETPIGHLDTTSHHKDPIQIIRTVVCETPEKNVPLGLDSLEQFTEPSFPPNDFRYNSLGDKKGDNQDSNSNHTIFEAGPQIAQHILAATSTPSRPVRHSDGKSHTTNADNCKEEDEQESCQRDAFSDGGDSNMVDSESDGGESPLAVPKMRIKRTSRTVGSSSGSDFEDDASTSPVESSEGLALFTVSESRLLTDGDHTERIKETSVVQGFSHHSPAAGSKILLTSKSHPTPTPLHSRPLSDDQSDISMTRQITQTVYQTEVQGQPLQSESGDSVEETIQSYSDRKKFWEQMTSQGGKQGTEVGKEVVVKRVLKTSASHESPGSSPVVTPVPRPRSMVASSVTTTTTVVTTKASDSISATPEIVESDTETGTQSDSTIRMRLFADAGQSTFTGSDVSDQEVDIDTAPTVKDSSAIPDRALPPESSVTAASVAAKTLSRDSQAESSDSEAEYLAKRGGAPMAFDNRAFVGVEKIDTSESEQPVAPPTSTSPHDKGDEHTPLPSQIPSVAPRRIYERSASLPTESMTPPGSTGFGGGVRAKKQFFEAQIKKEMAVEQLMTQPEEEPSPEHKAIYQKEVEVQKPVARLRRASEGHPVSQVSGSFAPSSHDIVAESVLEVKEDTPTQETESLPYEEEELTSEEISVKGIIGAFEKKIVQTHPSVEAPGLPTVSEEFGVRAKDRHGESERSDSKQKKYDGFIDDAKSSEIESSISQASGMHEEIQEKGDVERAEKYLSAPPSEEEMSKSVEDNAFTVSEMDMSEGPVSEIIEDAATSMSTSRLISETDISSETKIQADAEEYREKDEVKIDDDSISHDHEKELLKERGDDIEIIESKDILSSRVAEMLQYKTEAISRPSDSLEVHVDKSEIEGTEKEREIEEDMEDFEREGESEDRIDDEVEVTDDDGLEKGDKMKLSMEAGDQEEDAMEKKALKVGTDDGGKTSFDDGKEKDVCLSHQQLPDTVWEVPVQESSESMAVEIATDIPIEKQVIIEKEEEEEDLKCAKILPVYEAEEVEFIGLRHEPGMTEEEARKIAEEVVDAIEEKVAERTDLVAQQLSKESVDHALEQRNLTEEEKIATGEKGKQESEKQEEYEDSQQSQLIQSVLEKHQKEQLKKMARGDTVSSIEITDEDLRSSEADADLSPVERLQAALVVPKEEDEEDLALMEKEEEVEVVKKTLAEVRESLEAAQEELLEEHKKRKDDDKIHGEELTSKKKSPSEFEFKLLDFQKTESKFEDSIEESLHEDSAGMAEYTSDGIPVRAQVQLEQKETIKASVKEVTGEEKSLLGDDDDRITKEHRKSHKDLSAEESKTWERTAKEQHVAEEGKTIGMSSVESVVIGGEDARHTSSVTKEEIFSPESTSRDKVTVERDHIEENVAKMQKEEAKKETEDEKDGMKKKVVEEVKMIKSQKISHKEEAEEFLTEQEKSMVKEDKEGMITIKSEQTVRQTTVKETMEDRVVKESSKTMTVSEQHVMLTEGSTSPSRDLSREFRKDYEDKKRQFKVEMEHFTDVGMPMTEEVFFEDSSKVVMDKYPDTKVLKDRLEESAMQAETPAISTGEQTSSEDEAKMKASQPTTLRERKALDEEWAGRTSSEDEGWGAVKPTPKLEESSSSSSLAGKRLLGIVGDSETVRLERPDGSETTVVLRRSRPERRSDAESSGSGGIIKGAERRSVADIEGWSSSGESHYQSFEQTSDSGRTFSRPCSSDFEGIMGIGGALGLGHGTAGSSEYETALSASGDYSGRSGGTTTSQDYRTAVSSLSSRESMKSLDSESSGNLASVEVSSEASETLVPSALELERDMEGLAGTTTLAMDEEEAAAGARSSSSGKERKVIEPYDTDIPAHVIMGEPAKLSDTRAGLLLGHESLSLEEDEGSGSGGGDVPAAECPPSPFEIISESEVAEYPGEVSEPDDEAELPEHEEVDDSRFSIGGSLVDTKPRMKRSIEMTFHPELKPIMTDSQSEASGSAGLLTAVDSAFNLSEGQTPGSVSLASSYTTVVEVRKHSASIGDASHTTTDSDKMDASITSEQLSGLTSSMASEHLSMEDTEGASGYKSLPEDRSTSVVVEKETSESGTSTGHHIRGTPSSVTITTSSVENELGIQSVCTQVTSEVHTATYDVTLSTESQSVLLESQPDDAQPESEAEEGIGTLSAEEFKGRNGPTEVDYTPEYDDYEESKKKTPRELGHRREKSTSFVPSMIPRPIRGRSKEPAHLATKRPASEAAKVKTDDKHHEEGSSKPKEVGQTGVKMGQKKDQSECETDDIFETEESYHTEADQGFHRDLREGRIVSGGIEHPEPSTRTSSLAGPSFEIGEDDDHEPELKELVESRPQSTAESLVSKSDSEGQRPFSSEMGFSDDRPDSELTELLKQFSDGSGKDLLEEEDEGKDDIEDPIERPRSPEPPIDFSDDYVVKLEDDDASSETQPSIAERDIDHTQSASSLKRISGMSEHKVEQETLSELTKTLEKTPVRPMSPTSPTHAYPSAMSPEEDDMAEAEAAFQMVPRVTPTLPASLPATILESEEEVPEKMTQIKPISKAVAAVMASDIPDITVTEHMTPKDKDYDEFTYPETSKAVTEPVEVTDDVDVVGKTSTPQTPASVSSHASERSSENTDTDQGQEYVLGEADGDAIYEEPEEPEELTSSVASIVAVPAPGRLDGESTGRKGKADLHEVQEIPSTTSLPGSPTSDSFEMIEKSELPPTDAPDAYVYVEEVANDASEELQFLQDTSGKEEDDEEGDDLLVSSPPPPTIRMTQIKYYPADQSAEGGYHFDPDAPETAGAIHHGFVEGDLTARYDYGMSFERSGAPGGYGVEVEAEYDQEVEAGKKWIEMQFQGELMSSAPVGLIPGMPGYGYEMDFERGGPLEDIEERREEEEQNDGTASSSKVGSLGSCKESLSSTPEYDVLAGKKFFTRSGEHDDISMSSLQEFERLEREIVTSGSAGSVGSTGSDPRRTSLGSQDSLNGGTGRKIPSGRNGHGDDISLSSLQEFERLESACIEAAKIETRARQEEAALLSEIEEGHESQVSESESCETISETGGAHADDTHGNNSDSDDYEKRMFEIDEIIRQAQSNVEKFEKDSSGVERKQTKVPSKGTSDILTETRLPLRDRGAIPKPSTFSSQSTPSGSHQYQPRSSISEYSEAVVSDLNMEALYPQFSEQDAEQEDQDRFLPHVAEVAAAAAASLATATVAPHAHHAVASRTMSAGSAHSTTTQFDMESLKERRLEDYDDEDSLMESDAALADDVMQGSTDSIEPKTVISDRGPARYPDPLQTSTDSLDLRTTRSGDTMTTSADSIEFQAVAASNMVASTDSLELDQNFLKSQMADDRKDAMTTSADSIEEEASSHVGGTGRSLPIHDHSSSSGREGDLSSSGKEDSGGMGIVPPMGGRPVRGSDPPDEVRQDPMVCSTDSLEPSSSTATHATYQYETDSVMSSSFTSGGSATMVSSTDTLDPEAIAAAAASLVSRGPQSPSYGASSTLSSVLFDDRYEGESSHLTGEGDSLIGEEGAIGFVTDVKGGATAYVTEVIEPVSGEEGEASGFSHVVHRSVRLPPTIQHVTFSGPDAESQLRSYVQQFAPGKEEHESEETDEFGNVHVTRVVQKRFVLGPEDLAGLDETVLLAKSAKEGGAVRQSAAHSTQLSSDEVMKKLIAKGADAPLTADSTRMTQKTVVTHMTVGHEIPPKSLPLAPGLPSSQEPSDSYSISRPGLTSSLAGETGGAEHMTQEDAPATYSTTMRGSEFYQTQDPESTSEYDPSQTTTQARVVTTRTLTRTVMGEDGRPVSVTTTETEVSDGGGAEGVLDSNQLRESMQQIIDQFASEEEMKEGKESKEEKKPE